MSDSPARPDQPYTWVRCVCGNGLWRAYPDHLEMTLSPRGGQRRTISAHTDRVAGLTVECEKCGAIWSGISQATLKREPSETEPA